MPVREGIFVPQQSLQVRRFSTADGLRLRRLAQVRAVTEAMRGCPQVGLYVLIEVHEDPAARLAAARAVATRSHWGVRLATCDHTGMTDPATRPQLARLYGALARGEIDGIVAASRSDISNFSELYEEALETVREHGGFLDLAHAEDGG